VKNELHTDSDENGLPVKMKAP